MIYVKCWLMSPRSGGRAKIKTKIKVVSFSSARFQHRLYFQHGFSTVSARIENGESSVRTKRAQNAHSNRTKRVQTSCADFFRQIFLFLGRPYRLFLIIFENQYVMIDKFYLTLMGRFIVQEETSGKVSCGG